MSGIIHKSLGIACADFVRDTRSTARPALVLTEALATLSYLTADRFGVG